MPLHDHDPVFGSPNAEDGPARFDRITGQGRGMQRKPIDDRTAGRNRPDAST